MTDGSSPLAARVSERRRSALRRRARGLAVVLTTSLCLVLTAGCARGAPTLATPAATTVDSPEGAASPGPRSANASPGLPTPGYPMPAEKEDPSGGESERVARWTAEAYPGGRRPTRPPTVPPAKRTATRAAAEATQSAARDAMSAAIAAVLSAGATFELVELDDWSGPLGHGGQGLPVRLAEGGLDYVALVGTRIHEVASGVEEPDARLVWRMTASVPVTGVTGIRETGLSWPEREARGLQVEADGVTSLVVVAFAEGDGDPEVRDAFLLPGVLAATRETERAGHTLQSWASDAFGLLVGSTVTDREDDAMRRRLTVHRGPSGGLAPLVQTFGPDAVVLDRDGDGRLAIVAAADGGGHDVWRLAEEGLIAEDRLPADPAPASIRVQDGALPALPADLFAIRPGDGGEVWRWPATGGTLERVGPVPGAGPGSGPALRLAAPRSEEARATGRMPYQVARDAAVVVYALADEEDASHAVALGFQDLAAGSWHVVPISGTLGTWSVAPDGRSALYLGRGALSGVSWSYAAEDAGLFRVTPGDHEETRLLARCESVALGEPGRSLGCSTFAPDATWSRLAYGDGHGVWTLPMDGGAGRHVLEHRLAASDEDIFGTYVYRPLRWSPDGSWLYLHASRYEGLSGALLNLQTGEVFDLDAAGEGVMTGSSFDFAPDASRAGITRFGYFREQAAVSLLDLASRASRDFLAGAPVTGRFAGSGGAFTPDGRFRFGVWSPWRDRYRADGVLELDAESGEIRRVAEGLASLDPGLVANDGLPPDLAWAPDAEAFALAGARSYDGGYGGALVGTEAVTYDASEVLSGAGYLQWSRAGR